MLTSARFCSSQLCDENCNTNEKPNFSNIAGFPSLQRTGFVQMTRIGNLEFGVKMALVNWFTSSVFSRALSRKSDWRLTGVSHYYQSQSELEISRVNAPAPNCLRTCASFTLADKWRVCRGHVASPPASTRQIHKSAEQVHLTVSTLSEKTPQSTESTWRFFSSK